MAAPRFGARTAIAPQSVTWLAKELQNRGRRGRHVLKRAQEDAELAKLIGNLIWLFRETIEVPKE